MSGAGKTEAAKLLIGYLANINGGFKTMNVDFSSPLQKRVEDDHEWSIDSKAEPQMSFDF